MSQDRNTGLICVCCQKRHYGRYLRCYWCKQAGIPVPGREERDKPVQKYDLSKEAVARIRKFTEKYNKQMKSNNCNNVSRETFNSDRKNS